MIRDKPSRPFQFTLKQLLMLPVVVGLFLGIFIGTYPFSMYAILPSLIAVLLLALISRDAVVTIIIGAIFFLIFSFLARGVVDPREYGRRYSCRNNIKQILWALHSYHEKHGHFPPAYVADKDGRPMHSWRVLILPYLDHDDVYKKYRMDEPWDGPNNRKLWDIRMGEYECPEQPDTGKPGRVTLR
jgi:hypothetical protein